MGKECQFCKRYKELSFLQTTIKYGYKTEERILMSGIVLRARTSLNDGFKMDANSLDDIFDLNFCPECGKKIEVKDNADS